MPSSLRPAVLPGLVAAAALAFLPRPVEGQVAGPAASLAIPIVSGEANLQATGEGAPFLLLPVGAQAVGLARAMTALSTAESAFWNPAGLADTRQTRILLFGGENIAGETLGFSVLLRPGGLGTLGISYSLLDMGTQQRTDDTGRFLGDFTIRGHQAILSGATALASWLSAGANLKLVQFRESCRGGCPEAGVRATTYATDLGIQVKPVPERPLVLGLMVAHLGPDLKVRGVDESDPLPARIRLAASYEKVWEVAEETLGLRVLAEVEDRLRALGDASLFFGTELTAGSEDQLFLRGGYVVGSQSQVDGAALGFGLKYERFELAIARSLARGGPALEQEPMHLTLGVSF